MPAGAIVGSVVGGLASNSASRRSAKATSRAARNSIEEQRRQFDLVRGDTAAYRDVGQNALYQLAQMFGLPDRSSATQTATAPVGQTDPTQQIQASTPQALLESMPGFQFRLGESEKAMERMQAARGYSLTPRAAKEVGRYASDYASGEFGNLVESLFRLSGLGGNAVNTSASAGANAAGNIGNAYMNAGNAASQNAWNSAAGWNNAIQSGMNNYATWQMYNRMLPQQSQLYGGSGPAVNIGSDGWPT